jgi:hypothetical protein
VVVEFLRMSRHVIKQGLEASFELVDPPAQSLDAGL